MKSLKLFYIKDLYMNLPDDFTGDTLDALRLLVKIREEAEIKTSVVSNYGNEAVDNLALLWNNDKNKCYMSRSFMEYNQETKEWEFS